MAFFLALGAHTHAQGVGEYIVYRLPFLARLNVLAHLEGWTFLGNGMGFLVGMGYQEGEISKDSSLPTDTPYLLYSTAFPKMCG